MTTMRWASAASEATTMAEGIARAVADVKRDCDARVDLAVVFVSHHFADEAEDAADEVQQALPDALVLGCTAGGVIGGGHELEERPAVALTVAHLPGVTLSPFGLDAGDLPDADAAPQAWHAALGVAPQTQPQFVLLADPFSFPIETLLAGLDYAYPRATVIGGMASGARAAGGNALFCGDRRRRDGLVGVALAGNVRVDTVVAQGCRAIGPRLQITRCKDTLLLELDGKPPLEVIRDMLPELPEGDRALVARNLLLGVMIDDGDDFLVRNLIGIDPERGALAVAERLRDGQSVRFVVRDAGTSAEDLLLHLRRFAAGEQAPAVRGALLFSCLGRGQYLYGSADHDSDVFRDCVGPVPLGGFFCNGEIGPVGGTTHVHGYTSSFGLFRPADPEFLTPP
jgi:small ligand-binding sensory domain FIST